MQTNNYSTVIIDIGSGIIKAGFGGEDGPRNIFDSIVGTPKMPGCMVGMEKIERYVGDEAISKLEIMNFNAPIQRGQISDWDKFETLMHYLLYNKMKVVPEEISVLITESPISSTENKKKLSEILFETFNVQKIHIANSSMLGLFAYGKTSGLVVDSGFNITSSVPLYEGFPLHHASIKLNYGGEDISKNLLEMIKDNIEDNSYRFLKGRILADDIKEKMGYISLGGEDEEEMIYTLPDGNDIKLGKELYKCNELLFNPGDNKELKSIDQIVLSSLNKCDPDIKDDIKESICLIGGNTYLKNFAEKLRSNLSDSNEMGNFNISFNPERQFSAWIGGSLISSLENFQFMWVTKEEFDDNGKTLVAVDSKCF
jgi:actin-related protein